MEIVKEVMNISDANQANKTIPVTTESTKTLLTLLYSLITVVAIGGNGIVCYLVFAYKRMRTVPNYFIVNLAISDMLTAVFCIPFTFVANLLLQHWPFGSLMCPIVTYVQVVSVFLSAYTLVAMGVDRYIAVVHPFIGRITSKQAALVITGIWVVSVSIPLPTLIQSRVISLSRENNTTGMCLEHWEDQTTRYIYSLFIMVLHYFGPLTLLTFSYARICYTVWIKNSTNTEETSSNKFQLAPSKIKLIKMMITVVVFYALCWLPLHIITLVGDHDPSIYDNSHVPLLWIFSHWLAMSNSCYNPIIYLWMSPKFRAGLRLFLQACCWPRPRKYGSSVKKSEPALYDFRLRATRARCAAQTLGRPQPANLRRTVAKWPG